MHTCNHGRHAFVLFIGLALIVATALACCHQTSLTSTPAPKQVAVVMPDGHEEIALLDETITPTVSEYHDSGTTYHSPRFALSFNPLESSARQVFDHKPFEAKEGPNPAVKTDANGVDAKAQKSGDQFTGEGPQPALNALFSYLPWIGVFLGIIIIVPTLYSWVKSWLAAAKTAVAPVAATAETDVVALLHKIFSAIGPKP